MLWPLIKSSVVMTKVRVLVWWVLLGPEGLLMR